MSLEIPGEKYFAQFEQSELARILDGAERFVRRYIVLGDDEVTAVVLWIAHTHTFDIFDITPYLFVSSPEKQSGKSTLLRVMERLTARAIKADNITGPALFRAIEGEGSVRGHVNSFLNIMKERSKENSEIGEAFGGMLDGLSLVLASHDLQAALSLGDEPPTLLIDEVETIFDRSSNNEGMRGILNAGFERGGKVLRCVGEGTNQSVFPFKVFCPKAFSGIGRKNLPDTVIDRSIEIRMRKKTRSEKTERARHRILTEESAPIKRSFEEYDWFSHNEADYDPTTDPRLSPELPKELDDRAMDCWEPLIAIAELAGGDWPQRARKAALGLSANGDRENVSHRVELLAAIRDVFHDEHISSSDLICQLALDPESYWHGWWDADRDKPARGAQRKLANVLKEYGIHSKQVRVGDKTLKGYDRFDLEDAFERYLPSSATSETGETSETEPPSKHGDKPNVSDVSDVPLVAEGGATPLWGDAEYPDFIDAAFHNGHIIESEWLDERKRHEVVTELGYYRARLDNTDGEEAA
jgi:hypothetical protein